MEFPPSFLISQNTGHDKEYEQRNGRQRTGDKNLGETAGEWGRLQKHGCGEVGERTERPGKTIGTKK